MRCSVRVVVGVVLLAAVAVGCSHGAPTPTPQPGGLALTPEEIRGRLLGATPTDSADWLVLERTLYSANSGGKVGYYVTIFLFGAERETNVDQDCYNRASVGRLLPVSCRR